MTKIENGSDKEFSSDILRLFEVQELPNGCSVLWSPELIENLGGLWKSFQDFDFLERVNNPNGKKDTIESCRWEFIFSKKYKIGYKKIRKMQEELKELANEAKKERKLNEFIKKNNLQFIRLE